MNLKELTEFPYTFGSDTTMSNMKVFYLALYAVVAILFDNNFYPIIVVPHIREQLNDSVSGFHIHPTSDEEKCLNVKGLQ